jgi:hypothetical protein
MAAKGEIAALLIGKTKKPSGGTTSADCAQSVLDAIEAKDAAALDAALSDWLDDHQAPASADEQEG